jgi:tetratricopeptide (TPR) repeat protein
MPRRSSRGFAAKIVVTAVAGIAGMASVTVSAVDIPKQLAPFLERMTPMLQGKVSFPAVFDTTWEEKYSAADQLYKSGKYDDAYNIWAQALKQAEEEKADSKYDGVKQIEVLKQLALMYKTGQKQASAASMYEKAVQTATKVYGADSAQVAQLMLQLGRMYTYGDDNKNPAKAEEVLREAFRINAKVYGKYTIPTGDVAIALGMLEQQEKHYQDAIDNFGLAIEIGNLLEPNDISCCRIGPRQQQASSYECLGRYGEALKVHEELVSMARQGAHNMLPTVLRSYSECLQKLGRTDEASKAAAEAAQLAAAH